MLKNYTVLVTYLIALMYVGTAYAQATYPTKPIRIVTSGAGGSTDVSARIIASGLSDSFGQQVIVDNRGGGSGAVIVAAQIVAKAPADGYTFLHYPSNVWLLPFLRDNVPYDPIKDFAPISMTDSSPAVFLVQPSLPVKSISELVSLAKARPGALNYSLSSVGSPAHLAIELLISTAGLSITPVTYNGTAAVTQALLSGEVQMTIQGVASTVPLVKANRLKALAVTSLKRSPLLPDVPTMDASGYPGFEAIIANGLFAPARTPASTITRMNQELVRVLQRPEVKEKFLTAIGALTVGSSPEEFGSFVRADMVKWGKIIKDAKIRSD